MSGASHFWSRSRWEKKFRPGPGPGEKKILVPVQEKKKFWSRPRSRREKVLGLGPGLGGTRTGTTLPISMMNRSFLCIRFCQMREHVAVRIPILFKMYGILFDIMIRLVTLLSTHESERNFWGIMFMSNELWGSFRRVISYCKSNWIVARGYSYT